MPIAVLPHELIEQIFGYIKDDGDPKTLRSWSLLAQAWVAPSQRAIFHEVEITSNKDYRRLLFRLRRSAHIQRYIFALAITSFYIPTDMARELSPLVPNVNRVILHGVQPNYVLLSGLRNLISVRLDAHAVWLQDEVIAYNTVILDGRGPIALQGYEISDAENESIIDGDYSTFIRWLNDCTSSTESLRSATRVIDDDEGIRKTSLFLLVYMNSLEHLTLVVKCAFIQGPGEINPNNPYSMYSRIL
jgi:hypothetical protein